MQCKLIKNRALKTVGQYFRALDVVLVFGALFPGPYSYRFHPLFLNHDY